MVDRTLFMKGMGDQFLMWKETLHQDSHFRSLCLFNWGKVSKPKSSTWLSNFSCFQKIPLALYSISGKEKEKKNWPNLYQTSKKFTVRPSIATGVRLLPTRTYISQWVGAWLLQPRIQQTSSVNFQAQSQLSSLSSVFPISSLCPLTFTTLHSEFFFPQIQTGTRLSLLLKILIAPTACGLSPNSSAWLNCVSCNERSPQEADGGWWNPRQGGPAESRNEQDP